MSTRRLLASRWGSSCSWSRPASRRPRPSCRPTAWAARPPPRRSRPGISPSRPMARACRRAAGPPRSASPSTRSGAPRATARRARTRSTTRLVGGRGTLTTDKPIRTDRELLAIRHHALELHPPGAACRRPRLPHGRPGVRGDRLPPPPQRHHRRAGRHGRKDPAAGQDAEPRRVRARPTARCGAGIATTEALG